MSDDTKALVERARELAGYKYQYHTIHVPAVLHLLADTIERLESECEKLKGELRLADAIITREGNRNDALNACKARCEKLREALREAERGFELAYNAVEKGLTDEVLLHCGAHMALISTTLFRVALAAPKERE